MSPPLSLRACAVAALSIVGYATRVVSSATPTHLSDVKDPEDFSQFVDLRTLDEEDLGLNNPQRRLLFIGDVHGMYDPLQRLLSKLSYNSKNDMLIHVGDIVAKGQESLSVLDWFASRNITGVRGNHDQKVIEWRGWIDWVESEKGGAKWLRKLERKYPEGFPSARAEKKKGKKKPKKSERWPIPDGWEFNGDHYKIARGMTNDQAAYLLQLPLTLHLEPLHAFVVHAGVLPMDPTRPPRARKQPLARVPDDGQRSTQELSVLSHVPQNTAPWTRINVRSITPEGEVSRSNSDGAPWSDIWNAILGSCVGFDSADSLLVLNDDNSESERPLRLPCHPASVIYGHAASRGLDIKEWSKGLDTGCVYGKRLTVMVIGSQHGLPRSAEPIEFGEARSRAHLVSVSCPIDE